MNNKYKILVVEDEYNIQCILQAILETQGYQVIPASSGAQARMMLTSWQPDLILLDLGLPDADGLELLRELRQRYGLPVIVVSARTEESEKVAALELGADDYITKPFSPRELLARVRAVLRRYQVQATLPERDNTRRAFRFAGWELNLRTRRLTSPQGVAVELSNGEFSLLGALCRAPRRVLSRDQLLSMSRLHEGEVYDRTVDVQIRRLRLKIETDTANPQLILTERGVGYQLASDVETLY